MYRRISRTCYIESLTGKIINFPGRQVSHTNILKRTEIQMFFSNNRIEKELRLALQEIFVMFDLKEAAVFMLLHIYIFNFQWFWGRKCNKNCIRKFCSARILFTNVTLPCMSHYRCYFNTPIVCDSEQLKLFTVK